MAAPVTEEQIRKYYKWVRISGIIAVLWGIFGLFFSPFREKTIWNLLLILGGILLIVLSFIRRKHYAS